MAYSGENHRHIVFIGGSDHFRVAHGAAGLDDSANTGPMSLIDTVTEREEGIGCHNCTGHLQVSLGRLHTSNMSAEHSALLTGAHTDAAPGMSVYDSLRLDETGHLESEQHIRQLLLTRLTTADNLQLLALHCHDISILNENTARDLFDLIAIRAGSAPRAGSKYSNILLRSGYGQRRCFDLWCDDNLDKLALDDEASRFLIERPVEGNNAAERAGWIASISKLIGLAKIGTDSNPAGVGVLDDDAGRLCKRLDAFQGRVGIGNIIERQFLAL